MNIQRLIKSDLKKEYGDYKISPQPAIKAIPVKVNMETHDIAH
jgi:hypothetical protein